MAGIVILHASSMERPLVNNKDDFSGGGLKLFTFHGDEESLLLGSWLESQTVAIKSSGRGNVFLKLGAHILVVGRMQFLWMPPTLAVYPSCWRNMFAIKMRNIFFSRQM